MNHGGTEITEAIIGAAIEVHQPPGLGMLESVYEAALAYGLSERGPVIERQKPVPLAYKGLRFDEGYRLDLLVGGTVIVEPKCADCFPPIHEPQLLSYLKLTGLRVGLLINFNVPVLKQDIKRLVN